VFGWCGRRSMQIFGVRDSFRGRKRPNREFLDVFYRDVPIISVEDTNSHEEYFSDSSDDDSGSERGGSDNHTNEAWEICTVM